MLIGIEKPSSGKILKDGVDITNTAPKDRNIGIVFQNYSLFPNMDVYHNISYALQSKKDENGQKMGKRRSIRRCGRSSRQSVWKSISIKNRSSSPAASSSVWRLPELWC